ncbi:MAG: hypothetical protein JRE23_12985 [Deltaproteobacteria bacterium]|nr:hypothetical protein [Deltaproteobacteria bacterium]
MKEMVHNLIKLVGEKRGNSNSNIVKNKPHLSPDRQVPENTAHIQKTDRTQSIAEEKPAKKAGPVSPGEIIPMEEEEFVDF